MKTEFVHRGIAAYQDGPTKEHDWGFRCLINGWRVSFHYAFRQSQPDLILYNPALVRTILIPRTRRWSAREDFLRFRTLSSALAYTHADLVALSFPAGHVCVSISISGNLRATVRVQCTPVDAIFPCLVWSTSDATAVSLARACMTPRPDNYTQDDSAMLSDWLLENGPVWLSVQR